MDHLHHQLQHRLHTLEQEINNPIQTLLLTLTLGLPLSRADHLPLLLKLQLLILVLETTRHLPMLRLAHILGLRHNQVDH